MGVRSVFCDRLGLLSHLILYTGYFGGFILSLFSVESIISVRTSGIAMVVRNVAIFTGGAVIGAVAMTTYFKSKQDTKPVALVTPPTQAPAVPVPAPAPAPLPQVPAKTGPTPPPTPPVIVRTPPGTSVGHAQKIMPHGFPGTLGGGCG